MRKTFDLNFNKFYTNIVYMTLSHYFLDLVIIINKTDHDKITSPRRHRHIYQSTLLSQDSANHHPYRHT